jgi:LPS export ABC transporter protein LptC
VKLFLRSFSFLGIVFSLLVGGLGLYALNNTKTSFSNDNNTLFLSNPIETYIEQGEFVRFDEAGLKKEQLFLDSAYHLKEHAITHIIHPKLIQHKSDREISLSAKLAKAMHLGSNGPIQKIVFSDDVRVNSAPFELATSTLTYLPDVALAKTDALIDISSNNLHIQAKGMTIHLHSGKMELLNQVRSQYEFDSI